MRSPHPWLAAAWMLATAGQIVLLAHPVSYRPMIVPADVAVVAAVVLALFAFLAPQRSEASGRGAPPTARRRSWAAGPRSRP